MTITRSKITSTPRSLPTTTTLNMVTMAAAWTTTMRPRYHRPKVQQETLQLKHASRVSRSRSTTRRWAGSSGSHSRAVSTTPRASGTTSSPTTRRRWLRSEVRPDLLWRQAIPSRRQRATVNSARRGDRNTGQVAEPRALWVDTSHMTQKRTVPKKRERPNK